MIYPACHYQTMDELNWLNAITQVDLLKSRQVSAVELMNCCYDQIERINPKINALVNVLPRHKAVELAAAADGRDTENQGPLHGLPIAPKDMLDAEGLPTTFGFVPYAERIARSDSTLIARQRAAGAIVIGKSNMPEFGLGSHTFNSLFGATLNPYDLAKTPGGSSGGAAAALASGMLSVTDGSDMGGSLRNPASFCNVVGFRPSIGRVPDDRGFGWFGRLATAGPMARTVADAALLFSVQAGPSPGDPLTLPEDGARFRESLEIGVKGMKFGVTSNLGLVPVDPEVASIVESATTVFADLGATLTAECPDFSDAMDIFQTQRAASLAVTGRVLEQSLPDWRAYAKDTAIWNIERGFELTAEEFIRSELRRTELYRQVCRFFEQHDALLLPAAQVPPFDSSVDWIREINGQPMATYIDWMTLCCAISVTGLPAISVPAGFTASGLPVGLQIVGKPRGDFELLQIAHAFETATQHGATRPAVAG